MPTLGKGVYVSPTGSGAQSVTVTDATTTGDILVAIYCSQTIQAGFGNVTYPAGWATITNFGGFSGGYGVGNDSNDLQAGSILPGIQPANTVYTFTLPASGIIVVILFRCKEQILGGTGGGSGNSGNGPQPGPAASSPATLAVVWPLANPGFDLVAINSLGATNASGPLTASLWTPSAPTGGIQPFLQVASFSVPSDPVNLAIYAELISRNVAFTGTLSATYSPNPNGWAMGGNFVALGSTNTPSTLTFPKGIPSGTTNRGRLRHGGGGSGGRAGLGYTVDPFGGFAPGRWPPVY